MSTADIPTLLAKFDAISDTYLREEVEQALEMREELTPHLLKILKEVGENPLVCTLEMRNAHVYAALLLSHYGEPAAHELFLRAFVIPEELLVDLWGDMTTETLSTLLYRTCNGNLEGIKNMIANREVDQYVRCAAMEALSYAVAFDPSRRGEVVEFFQGLFTGEEADKESHFWGNMAATLCDLHPGDSMDLIRKGFDDKLISAGFISLNNVEDANARSMEEAMESLRKWVNARMPADIHAYISWFAEFNQEDRVTPEAEAVPKKKANKQGKKANDKKGKKGKKGKS